MTRSTDVLPYREDNALQLRSPEGAAAVTRGGRLQRVRHDMTFRASQGHIYTIDDGQSWMMQSDGYMAASGIIGTRMVLAPNVPVMGREELNPYIIQSPEGRITGVYIRGAMIGRSPMGHPMVVMETLFIDPEQWFRLALLKLTKFFVGWEKPIESGQWPDSGRLIATRAIPNDLSDHEVVYPIDEHTSAIIDVRSWKAQKALADRVVAQQHAPKRALSVLFRRLGRAHPAMPDQRLLASKVEVQRAVDEKGKSTIVEAAIKMPLLGWVEENDVLEQIARAVQRGADLPEGAIAEDLGVADLADEAEAERGEGPAREAPEVETRAISEREASELEKAMQLPTRASKALSQLLVRRDGERLVREIREAHGVMGPLEEAPAEKVKEILEEAESYLANPPADEAPKKKPAAKKGGAS